MSAELAARIIVARAVATQLERIANAGREALDDELTDRQTALEQLVLEVEQLSEELEIR